MAQGWILDETARGSVNIQEAVDRVTHAGQAAVALHTRGCHGGPAEGIFVEPSGMVLVLAVDMVRGVLHASRVRRACPQWTIQVYTPPRAWPFLHVGGARRHVAPSTGGRPHRDRGGNRPGPPHLAGRPGLPLAQAPGRPPSGTRGRGAQPRGNPPTAPRQEGTPLPANGHGPGHPARLRVAMGRRGGATAAGPLDPPVAVFAHGHPGPRHPSRQGGFPAAAPPRRGPARSLQAGAAWVRWKEGKGRSSPYFPLVQGQALLHAEGMGTVELGAIVPGTACRWITAAAPQPMRSPPACHRLLRMVPSLAPQHAFTRDVWKAILSHTREWLTNPGARYPPGPVLEQLTAPTPGVRHALHRASALTEQLNDEVLDLALEPLPVLYPQTHSPPAGTSNRLGHLGLQRRVEAAHPGGVVEQWLTLRNPSTAEGH